MTEQNRETMAALIEQHDRYRQALVDICSPIEMVLRRMKPEEGKRVDGALLVQLTDNSSFLQEIARKALEGEEPPSP